MPGLRENTMYRLGMQIIANEKSRQDTLETVFLNTVLNTRMVDLREIPTLNSYCFGKT